MLGGASEVPGGVPGVRWRMLWGRLKGCCGVVLEDAQGEALKVLRDAPECGPGVLRGILAAL